MKSIITSLNGPGGGISSSTWEFHRTNIALYLLGVSDSDTSDFLPGLGGIGSISKFRKRVIESGIVDRIPDSDWREWSAREVAHAVIGVRNLFPDTIVTDGLVLLVMKSLVDNSVACHGEQAITDACRAEGIAIENQSVIEGRKIIAEMTREFEEILSRCPGNTREATEFLQRAVIRLSPYLFVPEIAKIRELILETINSD